MSDPWTRRGLLGAVAAMAGTSALANGPQTSLRPQARTASAPTPVPNLRPQARKTLAEIIAASGLAGQVGFVMAEAATGRVLEQIDADVLHPPASVTKVPTTLYALDALGRDYRFQTRLYATGPVVSGVLQGDLVLAGGGDPNLLTEDMKSMAARLKATGLVSVQGAFRVWGGALPRQDEIDETQLDYLGYNPSISGLNLNFNRVHFEWRRSGGNYAVTMDARSDDDRPTVTMARMQIVDRDGPPFDFRDAGDVDEWSVARRALGNAGSRWLPVREPELYAGEVFRTFALAQGITLPAATKTATPPTGAALMTHEGPGLVMVLQDMLKFSTNLTAEAAGLTATARRLGQVQDLRSSAKEMTAWIKARAQIAPHFADHSGLGDASRMSAGDMVTLLTRPGVSDVLYPILKDIPLRDDQNRAIPGLAGQVRAKTGTLNFVSNLAGYVTTASGENLAFAIFAADLPARELGKLAGEEQPKGSITFNTRAKDLQQVLLKRWGVR